MNKKSLTQTLDELRTRVGEPWGSLGDHLVRRLVDAGTADGALKAGGICPDFALTNVEGKIVFLRDLLAAGPIVLSFYRGRWCPFCSAELEAFHVATPAIRKAGGTLVAISPEAGGLSQKVKQERGFEFEILCDLDNGVALAFGLVFRVSDEFAIALMHDGDDFPLIYGNNSWFLPIPATYIIAKDGTIAHSFVDPDYRRRLDPSDIITELDRLKS